MQDNKAGFSGDVALSQNMDGVSWTVIRSFQFTCENGYAVTVPAGFRTDLASIPDLGRMGGIMMLAATIFFVRVCAACEIYHWALMFAFFGGFWLTQIAHELLHYGQYTNAAVVHDFLYGTHLLPQHKCDRVLLQAMKVLRVPRWKRVVIFMAVYLFGNAAYRHDRPTRSINGYSLRAYQRRA